MWKDLGVLRVMLDSCVFDELLKDPLAQQRLEQAIVDGRVQVLTTDHPGYPPE